MSSAAESGGAAAKSLAVGRAFREAGQFDRAKISARSGVIAAVPVAGMMALGTAAGSPPAAVSMGVGAMLSGVAWRAGDGPVVPPLGTMLGASLALGTTAFAGTLSGSLPWLHLLLLVIFCLIAGTAACSWSRARSRDRHAVADRLHRRSGASPRTCGHAAALTGLVRGWGWCARRPRLRRSSRCRWPGAGNARRWPTRTVRSPPSPTKITASGDAARNGARCRRPGARGSSASVHAETHDRHALSDLVSEGRRIRLELIGFSTLLEHERRAEPELALAAQPTIVEALARLRQLLELTVAAIEGDPATLAGLPAEAAEVSEWGAAREPLSSAMALDQRPSRR